MVRGREDRAGWGGINSLPTLVMVKIFHKLDLRDTLSCQIVCSRWKYMIDCEIGINCLVGRGNVNTWKKYRDLFKPLETISKVPVCNCVVGGHLSRKVPNFKYPYLVKGITFDSRISKYDFNKLIFPLMNLRELNFGVNALIGFDFKGTMSLLSKSSPNIQTLRLSLNPKGSIKSGLLIRNATILLEQMNFPRLEILLVLVPVCPPVEEFVLGTIMNCAQRHNEQLREMHIGFFACRLESLGDLEFPAHSPCDLDTLKNGRLESFYYYGNDKKSVQSPTITRHLVPYLAKQCELRSYQTIAPQPILPFPIQIIRNNQQTLVSVQIGFKCPNNGFVIDCVRYFKDCSSLRFFTLVHLTRDPTFSEDQPDLTNAHGLPKSLELIQLIGVYCTKVDLHTIAVKFPKLKILNLICIGEEFDFGLSVRTIAHIIRQKVIQDFHVSLGINQLDCRYQPTFPEEEHPIIKEIRRDRRKMFSFHLNHLKTYILGPHKNPKALFKRSDIIGRSNFYVGSITAVGIQLSTKYEGDHAAQEATSVSCTSVIKNGIAVLAETEEWKKKAALICAGLLLSPSVIALL